VSILDAQLIVELRLTCGMSQLALAKELGLSTVAIGSLERGANHSSLTLHRAKLLADVLGVTLADLIAAPGDRQDHAPAADDLKVEAALALTNRKLLPQDLATAFGWSLERARSALESLRQRRAGTALRVHCTGGRYRLLPARTALTNQELQTLKRSAVTQTRISNSDAELLRIAVDRRETGWTGDVTEALRPALAHLINLGWIEHRNGHFYPSPEVTFSLGISDQQPRHVEGKSHRTSAGASSTPSRAEGTRSARSRTVHPARVSSRRRGGTAPSRRRTQQL
jgi:transcriptional regulator with XRE-family HTH domain